MDNSFHRQGQGSDTQQDRKSFLFLVSLPILDSIIKWLASLIKLTEEEQEDAGIYLGHLGGAVTMLLLAPQSGKDTRMQIQKKGVELRGRATEMVEDTISQVRSNVNKITLGGREKINELKKHGQELAVEQLDHVSEAAQAGKKAIQSS